MAKDRDIKDFFKPFARPKRALSLDEELVDSGTAPPTPNSKSYVLLPPSPARPRKALFTASSQTQRDASPSISSSPFSSPPPGLLSDDGGQNENLVRTESQSNSSSETLPLDGSETDQEVTRTENPIVKNSDDEETSSDSSLVDLDELLHSFRKPKDPISEPHPILPGSHRDTIRVDTSRPRRMQTKITQPSFGRGKGPRKTSPTRTPFSLDSLISEIQREDADEIGVAKAKSLIDSADTRKARRQAGQNANEELLSSVIQENDDADGMQRVLEAMRRTEAFDQDETWSFLDGRSCPEAFEDHDFPDWALEPQGWQRSLLDTESRGRAYLSGFVAERAALGQLPVAILQWTLSRVASESGDSLRYAYATVLKSCPSIQLSRFLQSGNVGHLFRVLKANSVSIDVTAEIIPEIKTRTDEPARDLSNLVTALELLSELASKIDLATLEHTLNIVLRLAIDSNLMTDCRVSTKTENAIVSFITNIPSEHVDDTLLRISENLHITIRKPHLRDLLLKHVLPLTSRINIFRCRLALSFFFDDRALLRAPVEEVFNISHVGRRLRKLHLVLNDSTDYVELAALAYTLDVAIDCGSSMARIKDKSQSAQFNDEVDDVAGKIKSMFTSMADSGASHMKRSEAKERFEALYYRLIYAVRTKPPPIIDLFGTNDADNLLRSSEFMGKFLGKRE